MAPTLTPAKPKASSKLDLSAWEQQTISSVLNVTLEESVAVQSGYDVVWLKYLEQELLDEDPRTIPLRLKPMLRTDIIDRILIARLELDSDSTTDDLEYLPALTSLPEQQTVFEYLVGGWKRLNATRTSLMKKNYTSVDLKAALEKLEKIRDIIISYAGLILQEPAMFPEPTGRYLGPQELVAPLMALPTYAAPLSSAPEMLLSGGDLELFLQDLARRFTPDNEIDGILGPVVHSLLFNDCLALEEGVGGADASWRAVLSGLEALVSVKSIAVMITRLPSWNPPEATASNFERMSLMGPLCRLNVFGGEWPGVTRSYFTEPYKRSQADIDSSFASLRGTLNTLQSTLFQIFNSLVRASPESREAVLQYFAHVVSLNYRRAGMHINPATVSSDSFMVNLQTVLLRFAEPFMDAKYSKMDRIDPLYYAQTTLIDLGDETRINATTEEANEWRERNHNPQAPPPNFITNIFYLTLAMSHYGHNKTIQIYTNFHKHLEEYQQHVDRIQGDGSWMGTPLQARVQRELEAAKAEMGKIRAHQLTFATQLLDPELVVRSLGFVNFLSTWIIRQVDPQHTHPNPVVSLPLPKEVPMSFRALPEYILEDIVDYYHFVVQESPNKFEVAGKLELMLFCLTFLTSTWYIKNPFLKSKINDILFFSVWGQRGGVLGSLLDTHPVALKHLMPAMMHYYIEVEQTGASSQFYDKFSERNIAYILKYVWNNPTHREALNVEAKNVDKFIRFVNLMINDVTYLMDESLNDMTQIHNIQVEMDDKAAWEAKPQQYRKEREDTLRTLERKASGYSSLSRSTVELLKMFTAETKPPFMMPEIIDRLAAMLDYNLNVLVGPRYQELKVRDPEKLHFRPRELLSDLIQIFLNLCDQPDFVLAVAGDGRSYSRDLFVKATQIAVGRSIKTVDEMEKLHVFVERVEEAKANIEAEEDLGEVPDEFLDPLMYTVMRDPVMLPSSRAIIDKSTIKSHLLSDTTDPFNRVPLTIEEVIPQPELKAKIEGFLAERRIKLAEAKAAAGEQQQPQDAMDVS
ncbi:hypothetical protein FISHEDRAFT_48948 [Fistulina hepatica ATCC 64428]|uniref:RING-type E3 ubiquitin transferase n=1 Tax=Fistulina hepatica ATCC 64428 TaxID=1128425 RepID=A0A0D7A3M2_9AGAR|nr:hypothetical protein FISHEDRAFT_48948 [Fistulina hepatica ATCC 64428]